MISRVDVPAGPGGRSGRARPHAGASARSTPLRWGCTARSHPRLRKATPSGTMAAWGTAALDDRLDARARRRPRAGSSTRSWPSGRRLLDTARSLDPHAWARAVAVHRRGRRTSCCSTCSARPAACRTTLTGERSVFGGGVRSRTPGRRRSSTSAPANPSTGPSTTSTGRDRRDRRRIAATARHDRRSPTCTAVWGAEVDWRLFVAHMFWDGWMHERDLLLPLGRPAPTVEARGAARGRVRPAQRGDHERAARATRSTSTLALGGHRRGRRTASCRRRARRPRHGRTDGCDRVDVVGDAPAVTDAIAGRPPALADVLDAPAGRASSRSGRLAGFLNA